MTSVVLQYIPSMSVHVYCFQRKSQKNIQTTEEMEQKKADSELV